ncbi:hypothetical protein PG2093B_0217 [Bifidobacterium pseudolongum subsp. globosum]|uniref:Uncharacterized protein n=1 Tax=Bifidobacterium pseudolongum subsp. globosum TaxID=1690 RepID=A0A4Q5A2C5_9BIFI|nr:hypothetical protein [Bifidobacterium pseudolongum]RYQ12111.1 hypothetical protein PG2093B_0217 [Bifidobacterium pseudolongum subsp. globosum]
MSALRIWFTARHARVWLVFVIGSSCMFAILTLVTRGEPGLLAVLSDTVCTGIQVDTSDMVISGVSQCGAGMVRRQIIVPLAELLITAFTAGALVCLKPRMIAWECLCLSRIRLAAFKGLMLTICVPLSSAVFSTICAQRMFGTVGGWPLVVNSTADMAILVMSMAVLDAFYGLWAGLGLIVVNMLTQSWQISMGIALRAYSWSNTDSLATIVVLAGAILSIGCVCWTATAGRGLLSRYWYD